MKASILLCYFVTFTLTWFQCPLLDTMFKVAIDFTFITEV